jgi:branched-chain amino acid transport system substrate-binding protein
MKRMVLVLGACCAFASSGRASQSVTLVAEMPLGQPFAPEPQGIVNAVQMAIDDAGGSVCGNVRVNLMPRDESNLACGSPATLDQCNFWDRDVVAANATYDVDNPSILGIVGTYNSGAAEILIPGINPAHLAMVSPANTYPGLTKPGEGRSPDEPGVYYPNGIRNYARVIPADDVQGIQGANWAASLGAHSIYIVDDGTGYGMTVTRFFEAQARAIGLQVLAHDTLPFPPGAWGQHASGSAFNQNAFLQGGSAKIAARILVSKPDLVYFGGVTDFAGPLFTDLGKTHYAGKLLGPDGISDQGFVDSLGGAAEGLYTTITGPDTTHLSAVADQWNATYEARFGEPPTVYGLQGYVSAQVLLAALNQSCSALDSGTDNAREAVRAAMMATSFFNSPLGTFSFDANGDTSSRAVTIYQVQRGVITFFTNLQ